MPAKTFVVQQLDAAQIADEFHQLGLLVLRLRAGSSVETRTVPSHFSYSFRMSSIVSASSVRASASAFRHPSCADIGPNL
ncbi:hypothetical protein CQ14_41425 [Bradyrhizobium lablabi]|uniref:Uncharacterized protein n=1 Tax=Bradyrhizobium lablabi TaxID=722472 RepID=A0A0R3MQ03_9BRAD|nr:hypothetical protein CQ14_41425 [Bradyrhizobium lablabi]